ncbi:MAG: hypothetical protein K6U80_20570 [Firmicutes bacterium]|nr:hypothetical protein [Bacillota bacterium]
MKKILFLGLFIMSVNFGCSATIDQYFIIGIGNQSSQLGFTNDYGEAYGPVSISEFKNEIYILDDLNQRINVYSFQGKYKKSIGIPKELGIYQDLAVNSKGEILLLTNNGIYKLFENKKIKKLYDIPGSISTPYYIIVDKLGNIALNGLSKPGEKMGVTSGIFTTKGEFKELNSYVILLSLKGLIGLKKAGNIFTILENGKIYSEFVLSSDKVLPFGLNDNLEIYCTEPTEKGHKFYKLNKNEKKISDEKDIEFSSALLGDDSINLRSFRLSSQGNIICLDANKDRCRVWVIHF